LVRRAHQERQRIALLYIENLRADFQRLLRLASVNHVLSPEIAASHESSAYGSAPILLAISNCSSGTLCRPLVDAASSLAFSQMVGELGFVWSRPSGTCERASVAAELASTLNRSGLDPA